MGLLRAILVPHGHDNVREAVSADISDTHAAWHMLLVGRFYLNDATFSREKLHLDGSVGCWDPVGVERVLDLTRRQEDVFEGHDRSVRCRADIVDNEKGIADLLDLVSLIARFRILEPVIVHYHIDTIKICLHIDIK